jgi:hypothetical protein
VLDTEKLTGMRFVSTAVNDWTFSFIGSVQTGRPYPVSTGDGSFSGSAFPALGSETNQRPNICNAADASTIPGCAGAPVGALVATNIGTHGASTLLISQSGVAAACAAGAPNCASLQTTFLAPAGASASGPRDSITHAPVDFQFLNGNLGRNLGLTKGLTDFDISLLKAFRIPKRESMRVELKMDVFNVFNHTNFIGNDSNDTINALSLPALGPGFNCTASCLNPYTGLYLGANGAPLTLAVFKSGRPVHNLLNPQWNGLGNPASDTAPGALNRVIQVALRIRW